MAGANNSDDRPPRGYALVGLMLLCLVFSVSCRERSSSVELKDELETVSSWAATALMVGEEWARGTISKAYAERTLRSTLETFEREAEAINQPSAIGQELRTESLGRLEELKQSTLRIRQGIEQKNRAQVEEELGTLKEAQKSLQATLQRLDEGGK